jgi:uncharacterized membrane protein
MDWYLVVKYVLILAVTITIGGMFARQLVRSMAKTSEDIKTVASLTQVATRIDRMMVIPASSLILPVGIVLSVMRGWPIFGFLQGASQNWLLAYRHVRSDPGRVHSPQQAGGGVIADRRGGRARHSGIEHKVG